MIFWLRRCTEQSRDAERPRRALAVGDHLDLDVTARPVTRRSRKTTTACRNARSASWLVRS